MSKYQWLVEIVSQELNEIKCHLCNERSFEGGVALGSLMQRVSQEYDSEDYEEEEEEDENEYNDDESYQSYISRIEGEHAQQCEDYEKDGIAYEKRIENLENVLIELLKNDAIFPAAIDATIEVLATDTRTVQDLRKLLPGQRLK